MPLMGKRLYYQWCHPPSIGDFVMNICRKNFLFLFACLGLLMLPGLISAQSLIKSVDVNLQFTDYDVLYLTDFINVRTQTLSPNISGISMDLTVTNPAGGSGNIYVAIKAMIKLQGDNSFSELVEGRTNVFPIKGNANTGSAGFRKRNQRCLYYR